MKHPQYEEAWMDEPDVKLKSRHRPKSGGHGWEQDDPMRLPKASRKKSGPPAAESGPADKEAMLDEALQPFFDSGLITEIVQPVKSGKEATVYAVRADPSVGVGLLAAKIYHAREQRNFQNDAIYREGRVVKGRAARAMAKKTEAGREVQFATWLHAEYDAMRRLYKAGAAIPRPYSCGVTAILMEYIGDEQGPGMQLRYVEPTEEQALLFFRQLIREIELWLGQNLIHGDLSPYNILYHQGRVTIIDFPQAVDPRFNRNAPALLARDVANVADFFAPYGVEADAEQIADRLWRRFTRGDL